MTGWIAGDLATRLRRYFGQYHWTEYELFIDDLSAVLEYTDLPHPIEAFRVWNIVVLDRQPRIEMAEAAWHEAAHILMHPANTHWLEQLPGCRYLSGKQERQAWEFVWTFPDWSEAPVMPTQFVRAS